MDVPYAQKLLDWAMLVAAWRARNLTALQAGDMPSDNDPPPPMPMPMPTGPTTEAAA